MARWMIAALILAVPGAASAQTATTSVARILATHQKLTSAEPHCVKTARADEIIVCAHRDADKYRVPFVGYDAGDPRGEGFWGERERLQHKTTPCQDRGPFLVGCGMAGISVVVGFDGKGLKRRKLAD